MAGTLPYGAEVHHDPLFSEDQEAAEAAREIKICLTTSDTSKALVTCDRMLSLRPNARLFEGLRLAIENKEREDRLEFIRRLSSELDNIADLDARINLIQQALDRYPAESQLSELLRNAIARRDLFNALYTEARNEEVGERYAESLKQWHLLRELYPATPGLENEIRRIEALTETQRKLNRRAEFVDAIFRLSSTGDYEQAVYQCINALAEYPDDGGLLSLKQSIEDKAQHATELQTFVSEGLIFLQNRNIDAALESFAKAKSFDDSNLQVRYLIGIALLEKARVVMQNDHRKLNALLQEAKSLVPNQSPPETLSFELNGISDENWENSLVRITPPGAELQTTLKPTPPSTPEPPEPPFSDSAAPERTPLAITPVPAPKSGSLRQIAVFGVVLAVIIGAIVYIAGPGPASGTAATSLVDVDIKASPSGADIFVDGQSLGASHVQTQLPKGSHTVTASLAGFDSQTLPLEIDSEPKALQIDLRPALLELRVISDQTGAAVWLDDESKGDVTDSGITISGVAPGLRVLRLKGPAGEVEISFEVSPGAVPAPKSLPSRQVADVLFAGSANGMSHIECNCAPAGLRIGEIAELIRAGGLELPLAEGQHPAELWLGKSKRLLTIHAGRSPLATIEFFSHAAPIN